MADSIWVGAKLLTIAFVKSECVMTVRTLDRLSHDWFRQDNYPCHQWWPMTFFVTIFHHICQCVWFCISCKNGMTLSLSIRVSVGGTREVIIDMNPKSSIGWLCPNIQNWRSCTTGRSQLDHEGSTSSHSNTVGQLARKYTPKLGGIFLCVPFLPLLSGMAREFCMYSERKSAGVL